MAERIIFTLEWSEKEDSWVLFRGPEPTKCSITSTRRMRLVAQEPIVGGCMVRV
jgi:hypothetical protein